MKRTNIYSLALASILATGCGGGNDDPTDGSACDDVDCGAHGTCVLEGGEANCVCDTGYTGDACDSCTLGYHPDGDTCVPDTTDDLYFGTPTIDGTISEGTGDWTADQQVGTGTTATDWGDNQMSALYAAYDDTNLYIGVSGWVEAQNALVVYIDTDYGPGSAGLSSIASATDTDGALDDSMSADLTVTDSSCGVDWGVGSRGMASVTTGMVNDAGWRHISIDPADFHWIEGVLVAGSDGFEASIPLTRLLGGPAVERQQVGLFARLVNEDGQYVSNQTLPEDDATDPKSVSQVAVITLAGGGPPICDDDGTCEPDEGETTLNCPGDCPVTGDCGDPSAFQWEDAIMYFVMVDRFHDSDGFADEVAGVTAEANYMGGDWAGVEAQLSYLEELGVNTIWLSAPFENRNSPGAAIDPSSDTHMYSAFHGYWPSPANIDYSDPTDPSPVPAVESRLGDSTELHSLIDGIHGRGMYVLFDYVMNHVDIESGLHAAHSDWFVTDYGSTVLCPPDNWDDEYWGTRCAFTDYLPPFDFYNPTVRDWSVADALWWAREYEIDGYRLDAIKHVPQDWLIELRAALNAEFPSPVGGRFYLVGETYAYDDQGLIASFVDPATKLDGQFDFPMRKRICDAVFARSMGLDGLFGWMEGNDAFYAPGTLHSTWIGNHDIPRAIHFANGQFGDCYSGSSVENGWNPGWYTQPTDAAPYEKLGLAFGILMTSPGVPLIYYGDEIGLAGGGDPDNRRMMSFSGWNSQQQSLHDLVASLTRIRSDHVALRRGWRQVLTWGSDTLAYRMTGCGPDEDVYILLNRSDSSQAVGGLPAGDYTELIGGASVSGGATVDVPALGILILTAS